MVVQITGMKRAKMPEDLPMRVLHSKSSHTAGATRPVHSKASDFSSRSIKLHLAGEMHRCNSIDAISSKMVEYRKQMIQSDRLSLYLS